MMTSIQPQGALKKAIQWISEKRKANIEASPEANSEASPVKLAKLVDEAAFQFDLSPKDSEFLLRFVKQEKS
jgi:hypothetical protein